MKLKIKLHTTKVLHVEVPATINTTIFEMDIAYCVRDGTPAILKDGITVSGDMLADALDNGSDWNDDVELMLRQLVNMKDQPDEFFFHR